MKGIKAEEFDEQATDSEETKKQRFYKYLIPVAVFLLLAIAVVSTNVIDKNITGAMIASASVSCEEKIAKMQNESEALGNACMTERQMLLIEKNDLETENIRLKSRYNKLEGDISIYKGIVNGLGAEKMKSVATPYGFRITWDRYVIAKPGQEFTWIAEIENVGPLARTFTLDLKIESAYKDAFKKEPAVIGSLTLKPYNSGALNVKLTPDSEGYAIFGIYVSNNYVGDLVVFAFQ